MDLTTEEGGKAFLSGFDRIEESIDACLDRRIKRIELRGYSETEPITCQIFEDGIMTYCNHAIVEDREHEFMYLDEVEYQTLPTCIKCWAIQPF